MDMDRACEALCHPEDRVSMALGVALDRVPGSRPPTVSAPRQLRLLRQFDGAPTTPASCSAGPPPDRWSPDPARAARVAVLSPSRRVPRRRASRMPCRCGGACRLDCFAGWNRQAPHCPFVVDLLGGSRSFSYTVGPAAICPDGCVFDRPAMPAALPRWETHCPRLHQARGPMAAMTSSRLGMSSLSWPHGRTLWIRRLPWHWIALRWKRALCRPGRRLAISGFGLLGWGRPTCVVPGTAPMGCRWPGRIRSNPPVDWPRTQRAGFAYSWLMHALRTAGRSDLASAACVGRAWAASASCDPTPTIPNSRMADAALWRPGVDAALREAKAAYASAVQPGALRRGHHGDAGRRCPRCCTTPPSPWRCSTPNFDVGRRRGLVNRLVGAGGLSGHSRPLIRRRWPGRWRRA